jgi:hypothetical protein
MSKLALAVLFEGLLLSYGFGESVWRANFLLNCLFLPQSNSLQSLFVRNPFTRAGADAICFRKRVWHYKLPAFELKS